MALRQCLWSAMCQLRTLQIAVRIDQFKKPQYLLKQMKVMIFYCDEVLVLGFDLRE